MQGWADANTRRRVAARFSRCCAGHVGPPHQQGSPPSEATRSRRSCAATACAMGARQSFVGGICGGINTTPSSTCPTRRAVHQRRRRRRRHPSPLDRCIAAWADRPQLIAACEEPALSASREHQPTPRLREAGADGASDTAARARNNNESAVVAHGRSLARRPRQGRQLRLVRSRTAHAQPGRLTP